MFYDSFAKNHQVHSSTTCSSTTEFQFLDGVSCMFSAGNSVSGSRWISRLVDTQSLEKLNDLVSYYSVELRNFC